MGKRSVASSQQQHDSLDALLQAVAERSESRRVRRWFPALLARGEGAQRQTQTPHDRQMVAVMRTPEVIFNPADVVAADLYPEVALYLQRGPECIDQRTGAMRLRSKDMEQEGRS
jgi:hypothetical protein